MRSWAFRIFVTKPLQNILKSLVCILATGSRFLSRLFSDRKKVLKHHPDKKAGTTSLTTNSLYLAGVNPNTNDDAFFKCIQKANEVLTNPEKRRQFDSVDPEFLEFEESIPSASEIKVCPILIDDGKIPYTLKSRRTSTFSRRLALSSTTTLDSRKLSPSLAWAT